MIICSWNKSEFKPLWHTTWVCKFHTTHVSRQNSTPSYQAVNSNCVFPLWNSEAFIYCVSPMSPVLVNQHWLYAHNGIHYCRTLISVGVYNRPIHPYTSPAVTACVTYIFISSVEKPDQARFTASFLGLLMSLHTLLSWRPQTADRHALYTAYVWHWNVVMEMLL